MQSQRGRLVISAMAADSVFAGRVASGEQLLSVNGSERMPPPTIVLVRLMTTVGKLLTRSGESNAGSRPGESRCTLGESRRRPSFDDAARAAWK